MGIRAGEAGLRLSPMRRPLWAGSGFGAPGAWGRPGDSASGPRARSPGVRRLASDAAEARWATQPQDAGPWEGEGRSVRRQGGIGVRRSADRRGDLVETSICMRYAGH